MATQSKHRYNTGTVGGPDRRLTLVLQPRKQRSLARHWDTCICFCSAYHPHVGKKFCSCFRSLLSGSYKRETPRLSQVPVLLMGRQQYHLFGPSKDHAGRPHSANLPKLPQIYTHFLFGWNIFSVCEFRCDHECSVVQTATRHSDAQLAKM